MNQNNTDFVWGRQKMANDIRIFVVNTYEKVVCYCTEPFVTRA